MPISPFKEDTSSKLQSKLDDITLQEKEIATEQHSQQLGVPYINLKGFPITQGAIALITKDTASKTKTICFLFTGKELRIGSVNPNDPETQNVIKNLKEENPLVHTEVYLISEHSFVLGFDFYKTIPVLKDRVEGIQIKEDELIKYQNSFSNLKELEALMQKSTSATTLITIIVAAAIKLHISDIHIEAEDQDIVIRFRIDGILYIVARIEKKLWPKIISRLKLLSSLKLNVTSRPQDGRFTIHLSTEKVGVRVSTLPTSYGESVVMRFLMSGSVNIQFEALGVRGKAEHDLRNAIVNSTNGMIITTGPTGSGKTTTLYAILNKLNNPDIKIITLEDPIEYKLDGIIQSQVDASKDYTFASGLRSILRQDPDVVMVGEIRDLETAETAVNAALTGHLVLSTIHTNSAPAAIPRFLAMGCKPFLLAPSLRTIIGQRLIRKLCKNCKQEIKIEDADTLKKIETLLTTIPSNSGETVPDKNSWKFYGPGKCDTCQGLGYKGRLGIYEIFSMNQEIEKIILSGNISEYVLKDIAVKFGMISMAQDGLLKALDAITSVEEVFGVAE